MNGMTKQRAVRRIALVTVMCGCVALMSGCGARRSEQARQEGDTLIKIGKTDEAGKAFARALELNPKNGRAKYGEGRLLELDKKNDEAIAAYKAAIALNPSLKDAYYSAAGLLTATSKVDDADALAAQWAKTEPEDGGLLIAQVYRDTNRVDKAIETLNALREKRPTSAAIRIALAEACLAAKQYDKAEQELRTVVDGLDTVSLPAWMDLVDVYIGKGTLAQQVGALRTQTIAKGRNPAAQLALARALMETDTVDEAETMAQAELSAHPDSGWANYVLGGCFLKRGKSADAQLYLQKAAIALPRHPAITQMFDLAKKGESGKPLVKAQSAQTSPAAATAAASDQGWASLWRDARLERLLEDRDAAIKSGGSNVTETLVLASLFTLKPVYLDELLKGLPADSPLQGYVAAFKSRKLPDMLSVVEKWNEPDNRERQILRENAYGFVYALMNRRSQALLKYSETMKRYPDNGVALYNLAMMYGAAKMTDFESRAWYKLAGQFPGNVEARRRLFAVYRAAGNIERAQEVAETTYALYPRDETAISNLAQIYTDKSEFETAVLAARRGAELQPSSAIAQLGLAQTLLASGKADDCLEALSKTPAAPESAPLVNELTAFATAAKGDWPKTAEVCSKAGETGLSLGMRYLCVASLLHANRAAEAAAPLLTKDGAAIDGLGLGRAVLIALGKSPGEGAPAELGKALASAPAALSASAYGFACYENRLYSAAFAAFKEADAASPQQPELVTMALASLSHLHGDAKKLDMAKELASKYPNAAAAWIGLGEVYGSEGDKDQQGKALKKAVELAPEDAAAWQQYARFAGESGDTPAALLAYRKLAQLLPEDPIVDNNLAYFILETGGDAKEAVTRSSKALEKMKTSPNVLHTLGLAQLRAGDRDGARTHLAMALDLQPGDPTMLLDFGHMLVASGDAEKGKAHARLALQYADQLGVDFPRRAEAEKLIGAS